MLHHKGVFCPIVTFYEATMRYPSPDLKSSPFAGPAEPSKPPTDPMSFPPGLLPALVSEHLRTEEAYEPLYSRDVDAAGIPGVLEPSPYMLARLERFYAELQVYSSTLHSFCCKLRG